MDCYLHRQQSIWTVTDFGPTWMLIWELNLCIRKCYKVILCGFADAKGSHFMSYRLQVEYEYESRGSLESKDSDTSVQSQQMKHAQYRRRRATTWIAIRTP